MNRLRENSMPKFTNCRNCKHLLSSLIDKDCEVITMIQDVYEYNCGNENSEYYNCGVELHNCCREFERFEK